MTVGRNIRAVRLRRGLTLEELSRLCGVHRDDLGRYERGEAVPRADTVRKIAEALDVPIASIRDGMGWTAPQPAEDWETAEVDGLLYDGILENLREAYGGVETADSGLLVGSGPEGFLLDERDLRTLMETVKASIPALIEHMKDTRPEAEVTGELLAELNIVREDSEAELIRRCALTDGQWEQIKDLLPPENGGKGRAFKSNRLMLDGILYRMKSGVSWNRLPQRFGRSRCVEDRLKLWRRTGVWERLLPRLLALGVLRGDEPEYTEIDLCRHIQKER